MIDTRISRPMVHLGTALTCGVPFGVMAWAGALLLDMPMLAWCALLGSVLGRSVQAWAVGKYVVKEKRIWTVMILFPLRDQIGPLIWGLRYASNRIQWRGET